MASPAMSACALNLNLSSPFDFVLVVGEVEPVAVVPPPFAAVAPFPVVVAATPSPFPALTLAAEIV
jgi:hypothetical protein